MAREWPFQWKKFFEKMGYDYVKTLGEGDHGTVHEMKCRPTGSGSVAIKFVDLGNERHRDQKMVFLQKVKLVRDNQIHHPNLVRIFTTIPSFDDVHLNPSVASGAQSSGSHSYSHSVANSEYFFIVMELFTKNLPSYLGQPDGIGIGSRIGKDARTAENVSSRIVRDVLQGLVYMHTKDWAHRDITPWNIMLRIDGSAALTDGTMAQLHPPGILCRTRIGCRYAAPELLRALRAEQASTWSNFEMFRADIWSLGVVLLELTIGVFPFPGAFYKVTLYNVWSKIYAEQQTVGDLIDDMSDGLKSLLRKMLAFDPAGRPTAEQALTDPWIVTGAGEPDAGGNPVAPPPAVCPQRPAVLPQLPVVLLPPTPKHPVVLPPVPEETRKKIVTYHRSLKDRRRRRGQKEAAAAMLLHPAQPSGSGSSLSSAQGAAPKASTSRAACPAPVQVERTEEEKEAIAALVLLHPAQPSASGSSLSSAQGPAGKASTSRSASPKPVQVERTEEEKEAIDALVLMHPAQPSGSGSSLPSAQDPAAKASPPRPASPKPKQGEKRKR